MTSGSKRLAGVARALALGLGLGIAAGAVSAQEAAPSPEGRLVVTGEGTVTAAPDMALLHLGVVAEDAEAARAVRDMSARMEQVLAHLRATGIEPRDIQTSGLTVAPQRPWQPQAEGVEPGPQRFEATTEVTVRLRDLSRLGALLDAVTQDGANLVRGLSFGVQDPGKLEDSARQKAVEDAVRKAALYAGAAGLAPGKVLAIEELGGIGGPRMLRAEAAAFGASPVPVAEGEISVAAQVTMTFALSPAQ